METLIISSQFVVFNHTMASKLKQLHIFKNKIVNEKRSGLKDAVHLKIVSKCDTASKTNCSTQVSLSTFCLTSLPCEFIENNHGFLQVNICSSTGQ